MRLSKTAPLLTKLSATAARKSCTLWVEALSLFDTQPAYAGKCLLGRSSGLPSFVQTRDRSTPKDRLRTIRDYLPLFADEPLAFEPGTRFLYSNGGYVVLGAIRLVAMSGIPVTR